MMFLDNTFKMFLFVFIYFLRNILKNNYANW